MYPPDDDPLAIAIAPPPDETALQREEREKAEQHARRVSDEIDEQIRIEKAALKRKKRPVKVLLLGQSESGKSATLKNFQMTYAREEWTQERASWRAVIQLNLVRNVNTILDILAEEVSGFRSGSDDEDSPAPSPSTTITPTGTSLPTQFPEKHRLLKLRLGPLRRIQKDLENRLGAAATEVNSTTTSTAAPFDISDPNVIPGEPIVPEFSINSNNGWKTALDRFRPVRTAAEASSVVQKRGWNAEAEEIAEVIAGCAEDMKAMWEDPMFKAVLSRRNVRVEDSPGFFLDSVDRIASRDYEPSDSDVIRARLRTLGVQEHKFVFDHGRKVGQEWNMYDVGGTRTSRAAWYPYFEDVDAIIFLAPISCFDEKLAEDSRVNRLEDSYLLWKSVCACKLLHRTQIILFLNKCDILAAKLKRGILIKDSIRSFGDRKNDMPTATKYFQSHFREIHKQNSPHTRTFYSHLTSIIDTESTQITLGLVEESILRDHLRRADLL